MASNACVLTASLHIIIIIIIIIIILIAKNREVTSKENATLGL
jgi:hypothetical protein